jgi:DNA repair protein RecN (Recombination protein N)
LLRELHICNLAVIEDLSATFDAGLNVFTGQTGAGKSLILGAFEILLGLKSGGDMLRPGADEARLTGVFELQSPQLVKQISAVADQDIQLDEPLLITRKLFASGRSSASVNGQPATAAMIRRIGQMLVDIHGQHDHQYLLKPANQLQILDVLTQCADTRKQFAEVSAQLRKLHHTQAELAAASKLRSQQLDLYEFQAEQIDAADPQPGEFPELQARHTVLGHLQKIKTEASSVYQALYETDGAVVNRLEIMTQVLSELVELDEHLGETAEQVRHATAVLRDAAFEINRYTDRLDADPAEIAEVEDRLNTLNRLIKKYGQAIPDSDPLAAVLEYRQQIAGEIEQLQNQDNQLAGIDDEITSHREQLATLGKQLTTDRTTAAKKLRPRVEAHLKELGMAEAKFDVALQTLEADDPAVGASGLDAIEMMVQTNPGQEFRPLRKIASGGELSRIMLAIKSILAGRDRISVLVFDEIDANIGGRLGSVIGRKLRDLADATSKGPKHQVLCITHMPQIAAFADRHLRISKQITATGKDKQTRTTISLLEGKQRIDELAAMMAGKQVTATTRKQAREMIGAAG